MRAKRTRPPTITDLAKKLGSHDNADLVREIKRSWRPGNSDCKLADRDDAYLEALADKILTRKGRTLWSSVNGDLVYPKDAVEIKSILIEILQAQRRNQHHVRLRTQREEAQKMKAQEGNRDDSDEEVGDEEVKSEPHDGISRAQQMTRPGPPSLTTHGQSLSFSSPAASDSYGLPSQSALVRRADRERPSDSSTNRNSAPDPDTIEVNEQRSSGDEQRDSSAHTSATRGRQKRSYNLEVLPTTNNNNKRVRIGTVTSRTYRLKQPLGQGNNNAAKIRARRGPPRGTSTGVGRPAPSPVRVYLDDNDDILSVSSGSVSEVELIDCDTEPAADDQSVDAGRGISPVVPTDLTLMARGNQTTARIQPVYMDPDAQPAYVNPDAQPVDQHRSALVHRGCQTEVQQKRYVMYDDCYRINPDEYHCSMDFMLKLCVECVEESLRKSRHAPTAQGRADGRILWTAFAELLDKVHTDLIRRGGQLETV